MNVTQTRSRRRLSVVGLAALYVARARRRWIQELLAIVGIASGVALLYATQVASTSLARPVQTITDGLVGKSQLQIVARGGSGMPETAYERAIALPGVVRAAPILQLPGNLIGPKGHASVTLFGADPRIVRLRGTLLRGFSSDEAARQQAVVVPERTAASIGVGTGDDVRMQLSGRTIVQPVIVADARQLGALADTSLALAPLKYMQHLAQVGAQVSRILVQARPGDVDAVRAGLVRIAGSRADVHASDYETTLFAEASKPTTQASTVFSLVSAVVGWLFAVCALLVTAADRRKLAIQQRDQGYPPATTLASLLVDVAVVGGIGTVLGLGAGELLSRSGFSSDVGFLSGAFPIGDERVVTWQSVALACGGGLVAAAFGVLMPVRSFLLVRHPRDFHPRRAGRERIGAASVRWTTAGLACLGGFTALAVTSPGLVIPALALMATGLVLVLPALVAALCGVIEWCNRRRGTIASVELALQQLRASRWRARTLAIVTTGAVAVFGATTLEGARQNLKAGLTDVVGGLSDAAPVWAAPRGAGDVYGTAAFNPDQTAALRASAGISSVSIYRSGLLDVADRRAWVLGVPEDVRSPVPAHQLVEGSGLRSVNAALRAGGTITMSRALADALNVGVGDSIALPTPQPWRARVVGITTNLGWSSGAIVMRADDFARAWGSRAAAAYFIRPSAGANPTQTAVDARHVLSSDGALRVETSAERAQRQLSAGLSGLKRLQQIAQMTLLAAVLAMSLAMTALLWQHRAFAAALKVHGPRSGLIWRMLMVESAVLFGIGTVVGGMSGLAGQVVATRGLSALTGFPVVNGVDLATAAIAVGLVAGVSLLVVLVPGYLVSRVRPTWRT